MSLRYNRGMAFSTLPAGVTGNTVRNTAPRTTPPSGNSTAQVASTPQDGVTLNGNTGVSMAQLHRAGQNEQATRAATDQQVNRMMVGDGTTAPTAEEQAKIRTELAAMDPAVLERLADAGTQIHVIGKDDNLFEAGLIRPVPEGQFEQNLESDRAGVQNVYQNNPPIEAPESSPTQTDQQPEQTSPGGFGSLLGNMGAPDPAATAHAEAEREREAQIGMGIREATDGRWMEYSPTALSDAENPGALNSPMMMGNQQFMNQALQRSSSLDQMASSHGFEPGTPEAQAFKDRVYGMNQERIDESRSQYKARLTETAQGTGEEAAKARQTLENFDQMGDRLPIMLGEDERPLLVPNEFSTTVHSDGKPQEATLTYHDVSTYHEWTGEDGKATNEHMLGQYFSENGRNEVIVRSEQLGNEDDLTLTHEMGHAVHKLVERENPEFFGQFESRLEHSHDTVSPHGHHEHESGLPSGGAAAALLGAHADTNNDPNREAVTSYAETNHREFFAEGYAAYIHDPERLQAMDPELFTLAQQANQTLGGR